METNRNKIHIMIVFQYLFSNITYLKSLLKEEIKRNKGVANKVQINDYGSGVKSNVIYGRTHIYYMSGPI